MAIFHCPTRRCIRLSHPSSILLQKSVPPPPPFPPLLCTLTQARAHFVRRDNVFIIHWIIDWERWRKSGGGVLRDIASKLDLPRVSAVKKVNVPGHGHDYLAVLMAEWLLARSEILQARRDLLRTEKNTFRDETLISLFTGRRMKERKERRKRRDLATRSRVDWIPRTTSLIEFNRRFFFFFFLVKRSPRSIFNSMP